VALGRAWLGWAALGWERLGWAGLGPVWLSSHGSRRGVSRSCPATVRHSGRYQQQHCTVWPSRPSPGRLQPPKDTLPTCLPASLPELTTVLQVKVGGCDETAEEVAEALVEAGDCVLVRGDGWAGSREGVWAGGSSIAESRNKNTCAHARARAHALALALALSHSHAPKPLRTPPYTHHTHMLPSPGWHTRSTRLASP